MTDEQYKEFEQDMNVIFKKYNIPHSFIVLMDQDAKMYRDWLYCYGKREAPAIIILLHSIFLAAIKDGKNRYQTFNTYPI